MPFPTGWRTYRSNWPTTVGAKLCPILYGWKRGWPSRGRSCWRWFSCWWSWGHWWWRRTLGRWRQCYGNCRTGTGRYLCLGYFGREFLARSRRLVCTTFFVKHSWLLIVPFRGKTTGWRWPNPPSFVLSQSWWWDYWENIRQISLHISSGSLNLTCSKTLKNASNFSPAFSPYNTTVVCLHLYATLAHMKHFWIVQSANRIATRLTERHPNHILNIFLLSLGFEQWFLILSTHKKCDTNQITNMIQRS